MLRPSMPGARKLCSAPVAIRSQEASLTTLSEWLRSQVLHSSIDQGNVTRLPVIYIGNPSTFCRMKDSSPAVILLTVGKNERVACLSYVLDSVVIGWSDDTKKTC